jgi:hypothetical protein
MQQPIVLSLAVVIVFVVAILPSITVAFVVLPPPPVAVVRLNYYPNGDLGVVGGGGYPPMTNSEVGGGGYLGGPGPESAVVAGFPPPMPHMGRHEQPLPQEEDDLAMTYGRALDCVNNFGMCDIDELIDLSEELDEYMDSCYVEDGPEACENEIGVSSGLSSHHRIIIVHLLYVLSLIHKHYIVCRYIIIP